jgi:hypothetical protein
MRRRRFVASIKGEKDMMRLLKSWIFRSLVVVTALFSVSAYLHIAAVTPSFDPAVNYPAGSGPISVVGVDFDGDTNPDLAVANFGNAKVSVLMGNGDGTVDPLVSYSVGSSPYSIAAGTLDSGVSQDLVTSNYGSNTVSVLLNNGDGTFATAVDYAAGTNPISVVTDDYNGDTFKDLAVADDATATVSILLNNGNGVFAAPVGYGVGTNPTTIYSEDLDGDTDKDLAIANRNSFFISVLLNNGDGTFAPAVSYPSGTLSGPYAIAGADLDGDTDKDLAVTNAYDFTVSILLNNGNGTFAAEVDYAAGGFADAVAIADLDNDTDKDLAVGNGTDGTVSVLPGNGDGTFGAKTDYTVGALPTSVAAVDLDGDTDQDLVTANLNDSSISILTNTLITPTPPAPPSFAAAVTYGAGSNPRDISAADLDGDTFQDVAVTNQFSDTVSIFLNNGNGTFAPAVDYSTGGAPTSVKIANLNGDTFPDVVVVNDFDGVSVLINNGNGTFAPAVDYTAGSFPIYVAIADYDGINGNDLAVTNNGSNTVSILLNNGNGTFAPAVDYVVGNSPGVVVAADLDGDTDQDLAVSRGGNDVVAVLMNNGSGVFGAPVNYATGSFPFSVSAANLNTDTFPDLIVPNFISNTVSVFLNNGDGTFAAAVNYGTGGSQPRFAAAADFNGDTNQDLAVTNGNSDNVGILTGNGDGTFGAALNFATGSGPFGITAADLDNDTDQDLAVANFGAGISILLNSLIVPPSPVAHIPFDEGSGTFAADSSGNGHDGTLDHVGWTSPGNVGASSFHDDGANVTTLAASTGLDLPIVTVSAWIRTTTPGVGTVTGVVTKHHCGIGGAWVLGTQGTAAFWNTAPSGAITGGTVTDGDWHLITGTDDGVTLTFYVDGASVGTTPVLGPRVSSDLPVTVGQLGGESYCSDPSHFNGDIDDVRIYDTALSAPQVAALYNANVPTSAPTLTVIKTVNGGGAAVGDFTFRIDGATTGFVSGDPQTTTAGAHLVSERAFPGYTSSIWGGDCAADGSITLADGDNKTCTTTDTVRPPQGPPSACPSLPGVADVDTDVYLNGFDAPLVGFQQSLNIPGGIQVSASSLVMNSWNDGVGTGVAAEYWQDPDASNGVNPLNDDWLIRANAQFDAPPRYFTVLGLLRNGPFRTVMLSVQGSPNYLLMTRDGAGAETLDTGVPFQSGSHEYQLRHVGGSANVIFSIDGVDQATIATSHLEGVVKLGPMFEADTSGANSSNFLVVDDYCVRWATSAPPPPPPPPPPTGHSPAVSPPVGPGGAPGPYCGNAICDAGENAGNCAEDCFGSSAGTPAVPPYPPELFVPAPGQVEVVVRLDENSNVTRYAVAVQADDQPVQYLRPNGTLGPTPEYHTRAEWGGDSGVALSGLAPDIIVHVTVSVETLAGQSPVASASADVLPNVASSPSTPPVPPRPGVPPSEPPATDPPGGASAPVITDPTPGGTVGSSTPVFSGTAAPGASVDVVVDGSVLGSGTASVPGGVWTVPTPPNNPISAGAHLVYAIVDDSASSAEAPFIAPAGMPNITLTKSAVIVTNLRKATTNAFDAASLAAFLFGGAALVGARGKRRKYAVLFAGALIVTLMVVRVAHGQTAVNRLDAPQGLTPTEPVAAPTTAVAQPAILHYIITAANSGTGAGYVVKIMDALPADLEYVPGTLALDGKPLSDEQGYDAGTRTLHTVVPMLPAGASAVVSFDGTVSKETADGVRNKATGSYRVTPP